MNILGVAVDRVCVVVRLPWLMCPSSLLSSKFKRLQPCDQGLSPPSSGNANRTQGSKTSIKCGGCVYVFLFRSQRRGLNVPRHSLPLNSLGLPSQIIKEG